MQSVDKSLKETEVEQRKKFLVNQMHLMGIYSSKNRPFGVLSLAELEWAHIEAKNRAARAYGER